MCTLFAPRTRSISRGKPALRDIGGRVVLAGVLRVVRARRLTGVQARIDERSKTIGTMLHRSEGHDGTHERCSA
jgi:hypothetical protein